MAAPLTVNTTSEYNVELMVKGFDLTPFLVTIRILNSIKGYWPQINLTLHLDNQTIIENDIFGQDLFELRIWFMDRSTGSKAGKPVYFKLIHLQSNLDLPEKPEMNIGSNYTDIQRRMVTVQTVPYASFNLMSSFVNKLFQERAGLRPMDVIMQLVIECGGTTEKVETDNQNESFINQLIIPPTTLRKAIDYVDEKFSIYKGPLFRYCNYDGHYLMWDLYKKFQKMKDTGLIKVYKLAVQYQDPAKFVEINRKTLDNLGVEYYTYDSFQTTNYTNSRIMADSYDHTYVIHPREDLYYYLQRSVDRIVKEQGLFCEKDTLNILPDVKTRKNYNTDSVGFEADGYSGVLDESLITSRLGDKFKGCSAIKFFLKRDIDIIRCMKVGEVAVIVPSSIHEIKTYGGGYLIMSSEITINKMTREGGGDNFQCIAAITGIRTVQEKQ